MKEKKTKKKWLSDRLTYTMRRTDRDRIKCKEETKTPKIIKEFSIKKKKGHIILAYNKYH